MQEGVRWMRAAKRIDGTMGNNLQKEMYQRATKWRDETKCSELQGPFVACSSLHFVSSIHLVALWHISFCTLLPVVTRIQPASTTMQRSDNCESHGALFAANGQDVAEEKTKWSTAPLRRNLRLELVVLQLIHTTKSKMHGIKKFK